MSLSRLFPRETKSYVLPVRPGKVTKNVGKPQVLMKHVLSHPKVLSVCTHECVPDVAGNVNHKNSMEMEAPLEPIEVWLRFLNQKG